jgi:alanine dehydrogenase
MRVLSDDDVAAVLELPALLGVLGDAFAADYRGEVVRPERPHYPIGAGLAGEPPLGTGLMMAAYIEGADHAVTKLATVHPDNPPERPTVNAQVALTDAATGEPAGYMDGTRLTNARTGCIGGLAVRELSTRPVRVGVLGAGAQARWQSRAIAAGSDVEWLKLYSPSDSRETCAADLREHGIDARAVDSPAAAVEGATAVVTATTSAEPVVAADAVEEGAVVVAVGAYDAESRELPAALFDRADRVFADVPEEVAAIGDLDGTGLGVDDLVPFGAVLAGAAGRESPDELLVVESVGTATLDAAAGEHLFERATARDVGTVVDL